MIDGDTELIAHIGYPTHTFKSPMIYNPYFAHNGINAVVMPMGCQASDYPTFLRAVFQLRPGEVTVAMNHPKTFVYVVRVTAE